MKNRKAILLLMFCAIFLLSCNRYANKSNTNIVTKEKDKIVLTVLAGQSTPDAGIEDMIDDLIAEEFPGVQMEWECVDWGEKFDSQMQGRIAAGDAPDIIVGKAQDVHAYTLGGNLAAVEVDGINRIHEEALQAVTVDNVVYGLPYNAWYQGVIYNKSIFKKLQLKVPKTRNDLSQTVQILEENGIVPFASHFQESWNVGNMTMQFFINTLFKQTKDWGVLFRLKNMNFTGNKEVEECLLQNQYILEASWEDALIIDQYESDRRFAEGEAAMYLTGSWSLQSMNQYDTGTEYGVFPYPNETGNANLIKETNMTFMISKHSNHKELINDIFENLLGNEKLMQEILDFTQTYSVVKGIDGGYKSSIEEDINWYENQNRVIDATSGNNQLVWKYQNDIAGEILKWLQGKQELKVVTLYADEHRIESSN